MLSIIIKKTANFITLLLCLLLCTKCSNIIQKSQPPKHPKQYVFADRNTLLMRGHSTNFVDGYLDGCQSGQKAAGDSMSSYTKNEDLAKISSDYLTGWEQGNLFCYKHMVNLIKHSGSNNPSVYSSKEALEKEQQRIWSELKK